MTEQRPSRDLDKIILRLPDGLRDRLAERAKANGRSANAEAVLALEAWLSGERHAPASAVLTHGEEIALSTAVLEAISAAMHAQPNSPGWEAFRKVMVSTGNFERIDAEEKG